LDISHIFLLCRVFYIHISFIEKNYYIGPETGIKKKKSNGKSSTSNKAYSLFVKILHETNKVAIGKVILRDKEHLVALRAYQRGLVMHQLRYLDEIRPMDEIVGIGDNSSSNIASQKIDAKELSLGKTLVDNLTSKEFDIGQYSDTYAKELQKLIETKSKGQKVSIETAKEEEAEDTTKDLLEALKASLKVKSKPTTTSSSTAAVAKQKAGVQRG
jgi:DNA end-binding protein Ku